MNLNERFEIGPLVSDFNVIRRYTNESPTFYRFESGTATIRPVGSTVVAWTPANSQLSIGNPATDIFPQSDIDRDQTFGGVRYVNYFQRRESHPTLLDFRSTVTARMRCECVEGRPAYLYDIVVEEWGGYREVPNVAVASFDRKRHHLYGTHTLSDELPTSGQRNYAIRLDASYGGNRTLPVFGRDQVLSIDLASSRVTSRIVAEALPGAEGPELPGQITFVLDATFNRRDEVITGTLRSEDGTITGTVRGHLFGPGGAAIGLVVAMTTDGGRRPIGGVILGLPTTP